jgi:hypothetical protein
MAGPEKPREVGEVQEAQNETRSTPRGDFLCAAFESDCARFVNEAKERARRRAQATSRELGPPKPRS